MENHNKIPHQEVRYCERINCWPKRRGDRLALLSSAFASGFYLWENAAMKPVVHTWWARLLTIIMIASMILALGGTPRVQADVATSLRARADVFRTEPNTPLTIPFSSLLSNDFFPAGDTMAISEKPGITDRRGTVDTIGDSFLNTPTTGLVGPESIVYQLTDTTTGESVLGYVIINVLSPDIQTPVAADASFSTGQNTPLTIDLSSLLSKGSGFSPNALVFPFEPGIQPAYGKVADILTSYPMYVYTPPTDWCGIDSFGYVGLDLSSYTFSSSAIVTIEVCPTNQPPVTANDSYSTTANTALTIAAPGLLANDSDADGDPLAAALVSGPAHGALTLNADGSFTYTPADAFAGTDSFTYKANDGQADSNLATVSIAVMYAPFPGFSQPLDAPPTLNQMKAGGSVPVKFSLGGYMGMNIFAAGSPSSQRIVCPGGAPVDAVEETTTNSGLKYDAASGQYIYNWKTDKSWTGTCRVFTVTFIDGSVYKANFIYK